MVEVGGGEDAGIEVAVPHETDVLGTATVLGGCDPFEVSGRVVGNDSVDVIALVAFGAWTMESKGHEDMAISAAKIAHARVLITTLAIMAMSSRSTMGRRISVKYFLPVGTYEIAVRMRPKDFAVDEFRRYFFEASG